jgi:hypothetical protein
MFEPPSRQFNPKKERKNFSSGVFAETPLEK